MSRHSMGSMFSMVRADKSKLEFQVGINNTDNDRVSLDVKDFNVLTGNLGVDGVSSATVSDARDSLSKIDEGIHQLNSARARIGAMESRLNSTTNTLAISKENLSQARSRIMDTDVAEEASALTRENILQQAGTAVLGQANSNPAIALKLHLALFRPIKEFQQVCALVSLAIVSAAPIQPNDPRECRAPGGFLFSRDICLIIYIRSIEGLLYSLPASAC